MWKTKKASGCIPLLIFNLLILFLNIYFYFLHLCVCICVCVGVHYFCMIFFFFCQGQKRAFDVIEMEFVNCPVRKLKTKLHSPGKALRSHTYPSSPNYELRLGFSQCFT